MRLHHLRVQAFGPFAAAADVDFDALAEHGLFLVHGPTGAGKTSILDAVCFALFGEVPGARRRQSLHSDHAPETRPEVQLVLTVAGRRLRVTRSPAHTAAKKRGGGTTTRPARVQLDEFKHGDWQSLSARLDEVGDVLDGLLGLKLEQFAQVVLLPQGEFATFLRAKADDRAAVLQRLFDISRFSDVETWLAAHRAELRAEVAAADRAIQDALLRVEDPLSVLDLSAQPEVWRDLPPEGLAPAIRATREEVSARLTVAIAEEDAAARRDEAAQSALSEATATDRLQRQAADARATLQRLDTDADDRSADRARLEAHRRTLGVHPLVRARDRSARRLADARDRHTAAVRDLVAATRDDEPAVIAQAIDEGTDALSALTSIADQLSAATTTVRRLDAAVVAARTQTERLTRQAATVAEQQEQVRAQVTAAEQDSAGLDAARAAISAVDRWLRAAGARGQRHVQHEAAAAASRTAATRYAAAEEQAISLRRKRLDGFASELAIDLTDGAPCPVCGSTTHPEPATSAELVTEEAVAEAERAAAEARTEHTRAEQEAAAARARLRDADDLLAAEEALIRRLLRDSASAVSGDSEQAPGGETVDEDAVTALRTRAVDAETEAAAAAELLTALRERADNLATEAGDTAVALATARSALDTRSGELAAAEQQRDAAAQAKAAALADHAARCACGGRGDETVAVHASAVRLVAAVGEHERALSSAEEVHAADRDALSTALSDSGFEDAGQVLAAHLAAAEAAAIDARLQAAEQERAKATGLLESAPVVAAIAHGPVDLPAAIEIAHAARQQARVAHLSVERVRSALTALDQCLERVGTTLEESRAARAALPTTEKLTDAVLGVGGDNALRMRLTSYVLAARLEAVVTLANERLRVMTDGRYLLEHTDALAARGARSGLGLQVRDAWTGTVRDTATLSGGESFVVSLALALGLGEAVLHTTGGRPLETLLVDEGFGSLDEDALETVMSVLDDLRAGGRTVGVVSHVGELRGRIPAQIEVAKGETGSRITVRLAASCDVA
ncbi:SMC family ATPase [Calidifontibacter sp. DB0510]|uniref:Nuclease SbcCD subunit C n=1 Tax=Metallococcus carri TaxID=1656884 RepID=A0A967E808_9MICO|nr:SMC family ATPase [Metallococcus carri]NHN54722.1 SMC family ATPase [Metallococcus carri]NOP37067.1 SMC family ATPase [Calidifontibacter sp. DB2511S]